MQVFKNVQSFSMNCSTEKIIPKLSIIINYMKKVGNHNSISRNLILSLALMLTISLTSFAQEAAPATAAPATDVAATPAAAPAAGGAPVQGTELSNPNYATFHK